MQYLGTWTVAAGICHGSSPDTSDDLECSSTASIFHGDVGRGLHGSDDASAAAHMQHSSLAYPRMQSYEQQQHHPDGRKITEDEYADARKAACAFIDHATHLSEAQRHELRAEVRKIDGSTSAQLTEGLKNFGCGVNYPYALLSAATVSFSDGSRLGAGSQGTVHRGQLPSGTTVAIKRIKKV